MKKLMLTGIVLGLTAPLFSQQVTNVETAGNMHRPKTQLVDPIKKDEAIIMPKRTEKYLQEKYKNVHGISTKKEVLRLIKSDPYLLKYLKQEPEVLYRFGLNEDDLK